jgi:hypothetical protein
MRFILLSVLVICVSSFVHAQSKTTEALHKSNEEAFALFFYNNTLRMLNQQDDPEFDALIKDIQKMKFLMIEKNPTSFNYKSVVKDYKSESFEEVMTSRHEGKSFDIFVKEESGKTKGMLVLVNDSTNFYVLDILGSIALNKVTKLYSTLEESSDIGKKIKAFTDHGKGPKKKD